MAIKVEKQLKRRGGSSIVNRVNRFSEQPSWKKNSPGVNKTDFKPKIEVKPNPFTPKTSNSATSSTFRNRDIKCFKCQGLGHKANECPNKRSMIVRDDGEVVTDEEEDDHMPSLEDVSDKECVAATNLTLVTTSVECTDQGSRERATGKYFPY